MRICLVSPGHLSTNPRLFKEALTLHHGGHDVTVICSRFSPWGSAADAELAKHLPHCVAVPFGPTEARPSTYLRQTAVRHAANWMALLGIAGRRGIEASHHPIVRDLARMTMRVRADLYIAHYVAALPAAANAARRHGGRFAFDAEDFHLGDLPDVPAHWLERKIIHAIEARYLPDAAYVTAASPMIAEAYVDAYKISEPQVILNVFPKANAPASPTPRGTPAHRPSLYWFSQTVGPGRGLETAVDALAQARSKPGFYLRGTPASGYQVSLVSRAERLGVANRLHFLPPAAPGELERLGAEYDLGFSGETGFSSNNKLALGNKLFSYLSSGLPIVASDIPSHKRLAPELGEAMWLFRSGSAIALAHAIDNLLLEPDRLKACRAHSWALGQTRFSWDCEQTNIIKIVEKAMR